MGKKWRLFQPMTAFQQRFSDQSKLSGVGGFERQFEIANTSV